MSFFIEMRCEMRGEGRDTKDNRCESDDNGGPMDSADDSQSGVASTIKFLIFEAKKAGWRNIRGTGWVCPACQKHMTKNGE
ncbi:hypothetical protein AACK17_10910 [Pectobacterium punjabense]|uniref:hypothetical protein n=1 Tax=Pectobacterium punjabense TaxID=2108399 RepID=UPI00311E2492